MGARRIRITLTCPCGYNKEHWSMWNANQAYSDHLALCPTGRGDPPEAA